MKRSWIGAGILGALLLAAVLVTAAMEDLHAPVARSLDAAREAAEDGRWEQALTIAGEARSRWEKWETVRACFCDHDPMEQIDAGLAQLAVWAEAGETLNFAATAAQTARQIEAIYEAHKFTLGNIL